MLGSRAAPCHRQSPPIRPDFKLSRGRGAGLRRLLRHVHAHRAPATTPGWNYYLRQRHTQFDSDCAGTAASTAGAQPKEVLH